MAILRTKNLKTGEWEEAPNIAGKNGKTAYQYALEGGFTGTETEFMQKLAIESYSKGEADAKFLTTESDPTVPAWAKEATKPSYTAGEVGADASGSAAAALASANAHTDTHANNKDNPHGVTAAQVGADAAGSAAAALDEAKKYTDGEIAELINGAPTTLDTLGEIATAMAENADVVAALDEAIGSKADAQTVAALQTAVAGKAEASAVSALETTVNGKAAAADLTAHTGSKNNPHGVTAEQVGAVPTTRTVNGKALSADISLSAADVGAASADDFATLRSEFDNLDIQPSGNEVLSITSTDGDAYTVSIPWISASSMSELVGKRFTVIPNKTCIVSSPSLNVNGLGAKAFKRMNTTRSDDWYTFGSASWLKAGYPIQIMYSGVYWLVESMPQTLASDLKGTVPIANGGTGATSAAEARTKLGINSESWTFTLEDGSTVTKAVYIG